MATAAGELTSPCYVLSVVSGSMTKFFVSKSMVPCLYDLMLQDPVATVHQPWFDHVQARAHFA